MNEELKKDLEDIAILEEKYGVLGVSFYTEQGTDVTTEDSTVIVKNILQTVGDINDGTLKFITPDFELLDSLKNI